jgi:hypothetical protein
MRAGGMFSFLEAARMRVLDFKKLLLVFEIPIFRSISILEPLKRLQENGDVSRPRYVAI